MSFWFVKHSSQLHCDKACRNNSKFAFLKSHITLLYAWVALLRNNNSIDIVQWSFVETGGDTETDLTIWGIFVRNWSTVVCDVEVILVGCCTQIWKLLDSERYLSFAPGTVFGSALRSPAIMILAAFISSTVLMFSCR